MRDCLLRRSEAAGVRWRDLEREPDGSGRLTVPYSKTDQLGKGAILFVTKETMRAMWEIRPPTLKPGKRIFDCHPCTVCRYRRPPGRAGRVCTATSRVTPHGSAWSRILRALVR